MCSMHSEVEGNVRPIWHPNCAGIRQWSSILVVRFKKKYGFTHVTMNPYMPNTYGEAERAVQTAKRILIQEHRLLGLVVYRDTIISASGCSPAQLMMGRHIRTILVNITVGTEAKLAQSRPGQKDYDKSYQFHCNRRHGTQPLPPLCPGDMVRVRTDLDNNWTKKGVVTNPTNTPRSYTEQTESGTSRRNMRQLQARAT